LFNSIILLTGFTLLKIPKKINAYNRTIFKVLIFSTLSNAIYAAIKLFVFYQIMWAWAKEFYVLIIIPSAAIYFFNYYFTFNNLEISKLKKILICTALAVLISPCRFEVLYDSALDLVHHMII